MSLFRKIAFLLMLSPIAAIACDKFKIPVEVINEHQVEPTYERGAGFLILAPLEFEGWKLSGGSYKNGNNQIPMQFYIDPEHEGKGVMYLKLDQHFIKDSKVLVSYTPVEKIDENGVSSIALCLHTEEVSFDI